MSDWDQDRKRGGSTRGAWGIFAAVIAVISIGGYLTTMATVKPGHVGVLVDKPVLFGHGGVRPDVMETGRGNLWWTTELVEMSTAPHTIKAHIDDMMSKNRVPLDFDVAITIELGEPKGAAELQKRFNAGVVTAFSRIMMPGLDLNTLTATNPSGEFMSFLRDQVREYHMDEFMIAQKADGQHSDASKDVERLTLEYMNKFLKDAKVPIRVTNVALGRANPPEGVKASMERTAEQVQLQTTERERAEAQRQRKVAETASAEADAAQQAKLGFTNEQFLRKLELEVMQKICGSSSKEMKDNKPGTGPNCTFIIGGAVAPVIPVGGTVAQR